MVLNIWCNYIILFLPKVFEHIDLSNSVDLDQMWENLVSGQVYIATHPVVVRIQL